MQSIGLLSTFRYRHPNRQRHTYARNNTAVTLDDIYISARSAHKLSASGIWLHTIHSSDHAGTPFLALALCPGDHTPSRLSGVKPIRVVNTRYLTKGDISTFGDHTSQLLLEGRLPPLITAPLPRAATMWSPQETTDWLEGAVQNLYDILYTSAKLKWGETSQTKKALNRAVAIQRTNRSSAQLRRLLRIHEAVTPTGDEYHRLIDIRTAFVWLDGGIREFGLGQGSILAVMHIGYYMDVLIRQQQELQYIINAVWIPSVMYRTAISDAISIAPALDILFRKTARRVLRLPHDHPNSWFYDHTDGLGLSYQTESGLTDHPLAFRIPPPASDTTFIGTLLRDLATSTPALTITTQWHQPPTSRPQRPNDRPILAHLIPALSTTLISINHSHANKVRWVGDFTNEKGTMLLSLPSFCTKYGWNRATLKRFSPIWDAIPTVTPHNPLYSGNRLSSGVLNIPASHYLSPLCRLYHGPIFPTWINP
ncbi:hypothetical protein B5M09_013019 [Aphanomyces astaci]|uniref:Uncharacterized protein n=1 Tax=Aphanomyces astaci TaxID=112090 RepID=A0A425CX49_APHAT|nr:hypothetical protein B5M09_013019 [Aphanomyces astaci]